MIASVFRMLGILHWPERYQSMPVMAALRALHRTGRIYKDANTLVDPRSGGEWPTLTPRVDHQA